MEEMDKQKALWQECNVQCGALLIYKVILNVVVAVVMFVAAFSLIFSLAFSGAMEDMTTSVELTQVVMDDVLAATGWGYLLAVAVGIGILLLWKKPAYISNVLLQRGKPMRVGSFFVILSFFLAFQLLVQAVSYGLEALLNQFDLSLMELLESSSANMDSFSMLLYIGIAAPITEELIFRGLILRSLEPYGKGIAILVSAFLFGMFHGNPIQTPFAMLVGVILAYTTLEYNILWAMVLHMINNLILGDTLPRLLEGIRYGISDTVTWGIILVAALAALTITLVNWRKVPAFLQQLRTEKWQWKKVFTSPCMIILTVSCVLDMVLLAAMLVFL